MLILHNKLKLLNDEFPSLFESNPFTTVSMIFICHVLSPSSSVDSLTYLFLDWSQNFRCAFLKSVYLDGNEWNITWTYYLRTQHITIHVGSYPSSSYWFIWYDVCIALRILSCYIEIQNTVNVVNWDICHCDFGSNRHWQDSCCSEGLFKVNKT